MKTKHVFYTMAFASAALASCTAEQITTNGNVNVEQDLSVRPVLGDIELVEGDILSRFGLGELAQPIFVEGDQLGACIMDKVKDGGYPTNGDYEKDPSTAYAIVDFYSSNNAFTKNNGIWTVDQPLVEGNYLFYAPYNKKMQMRTPLQIVLPEYQDVSEEKSALEDFYNSGSVVRLGYQFLAAKNGEAQKPQVTMHDVFAYPKFTIKNNFNGYLESTSGSLSAYNGEMRVDSIQLVTYDNLNNAIGTFIGGTLDNEKVAELMTEKEGATGNKWETTVMECYTTDLLSDTKTSTKAATSNDPRNHVITTLKYGKSLAQGEEAEFYAVVPAMQFDGTNKKLQARIYVTIGDEKQYLISTASLITSSGNSLISKVEGTTVTSTVGTVTLVKGQRFPQEELNFEDGKVTAKPSAGSILTIDIKGGKVAGNVQYAKEVTKTSTPVVDKISNNAEFIQFFKDQLNGTALEEGSGNGKYQFADNNTVEINAELINALSNYNNKGTIKIDTALPVSNDVTVTVGDEVSGATNYVQVTFATSTASYNVYLKKSVENQGYHGTDKTIGVLYSCSGTANNYKSIVVPSEAELSLGTPTTVGNINNSGEITISDAVTPTVFNNNNGAILNISNTVNNAITNNGTINVNSVDAKFTVNAGNGMITMTSTNAAAAANIVVIGGEQKGIYSGASLTVEDVKAAEAISWVNALSAVSGTAQFSQNILDELKDINTITVSSATFPAGEFDLSGLTLEFDNTDAMSLTGHGVATTTLKNATLVNMTEDYNLTLTTINAFGTYRNSTTTSTAKIVADGTYAKWNGAAINND